MILLTGITGTTGKKVLDLLSKEDIPVRAMVRDLDKVKDLTMPGLEIIQGDLEDASSIENAMKGVDKAFLMMANVEKQLDNEKRFIDVAKQSNISHLVKLSASNAEAGSSIVLKRYHGDAEQYLAASGLGYTNIRPNYFMQNMLHASASIIAEDKFYLPFAKGRTGIIDVADVASFIVEVLTGSGHDGQTYDISGSEILSFYDLAEQMSAVLGREITYVDVPPEGFRNELKKWSPSEWFVDTIMEQFKLTAEDKGAMVTDTFQKVVGRAPRLFTQFVEDHASAFSAS
ncbi:MAG: hypothetical protein ACI909_000828 [Planctomycetota bacterium]|jgi:uncharacterized protein YbjT (DUF2867 family)